MAVDDGRLKRTTAELVARGERLAEALRGLGVAAGDRVAIVSENRTEYVESDVGISLVGAVRVALNSRLAPEDFDHMIEDSSPRALLHSGRFAETAARLAERHGLVTVDFDGSGSSPNSFHDLIDRAAAPSSPPSGMGDPERPAWITYTSGTTGRPKGIVLSHRSIRQVALNLALEFGPRAPGEQIVLSQPLSHGAGYFVLPFLMAGGGLRILDRFDPEQILGLAAAPEVTTLKVVPTMLSLLLEHGFDGELGYDTIIYGAAPIPGPLLEASLERFGPLLVQIYGQSEAPATITCLQKHDHLGGGAHRFSAGRPWRSVAVEVHDEDGRSLPPDERGEVVVRAPQMMSGYHGMPRETEEAFRDGWLRTKDVGVIDEHGYVHLLGRSDEMINSGGFNIAPREVEQVLAQHQDVEEVCVMGRPDERWGAAVVGALLLRPGAEAEPDEIIEFAKPRLGFRVPRQLVVVDDLPRNAYGKIDRAAVREQIEKARP